MGTDRHPCSRQTPNGGRRLGELTEAASLASAILHEQQPHGRPRLALAAAAVSDKLASGPLIRHVVAQLRPGQRRGVAAAVTGICQQFGAAAVGPLAEALAVEENSHAIRALTQILLDFGAVGRSSVEQLKNATNPAVRRTAIDLLRVFGGNDALPELESCSATPTSRCSAMPCGRSLQIGTDAAYVVLNVDWPQARATRSCSSWSRCATTRPPLCSATSWTSTPPSGANAATHLHVIEALGALGAHGRSTASLRTALYRGIWWAPKRDGGHSRRRGYRTDANRFASNSRGARRSGAYGRPRRPQDCARKDAAMARRERERA